MALLRNEKAGVFCNITGEVFKAGGQVWVECGPNCLMAIWYHLSLPKEGLFIPLWKEKEDRQNCNQYRGIVLFTFPGSTCSSIADADSQLMQLQRSETSGFTPEKPQTYRYIVLCVLVESRREFRHGILASYVDLKGFVSVHLEALWDFIQLCGIS